MLQKKGETQKKNSFASTISVSDFKAFSWKVSKCFCKRPDMQLHANWRVCSSTLAFEKKTMKEVVEIFSVTLEIQWYLNAFRDDTHKIFCYVDVKYYMLENQVSWNNHLKLPLVSRNAKKINQQSKASFVNLFTELINF